MRNRTIDILLFESLLDDIGSTGVDVTSAADKDVDTQIDYDAYEYEWRIYFASQIPDYKEFITQTLPRIHEQLSVIVTATRLFTSVSPVRIMSHEADQMKNHYGFGDVPVMRDYVDQINGDWPYYAWTAVFCCNMPPVKNIRRFLTFIGLLNEVTFKTAPVSAQFPIISVRQKERDIVTFWPSQLTPVMQIVKNELKRDKQTNAALVKFMGQYYL